MTDTSAIASFVMHEFAPAHFALPDGKRPDFAAHLVVSLHERFPHATESELRQALDVAKAFMTAGKGGTA